MIKDRLVSLINEYVGEFVENINHDNLNYSVLQGKPPRERERERKRERELIKHRDMFYYVHFIFFPALTGRVELKDLVLKPSALVSNYLYMMTQS